MGKINTRVQHKHDQESNWGKATNFTPLEGELILYDSNIITDESTGETTLVMGYNFKIGNGTNKINDLPFILPDLQNGTGDRALQQKGCHASGARSLALGENTYATDTGSASIGSHCTSSGQRSFTFGWNVIASNNYAVAFGKASLASGFASLSIGDNTKAQGQFSMAQGCSNVAFGRYQNVNGKYNEIDNGMGVAPTWGSGTTYPISQIVTYNKQYYICLSSENKGKQPDINPTVWGLQSSYYRGSWSAAETYQSYQLVLHNNQIYISRTNNNIGVEPGSNESIWYPQIDSFYAHILGWGKNDTNRLNIHTVSTTGDGWFKGDLYVGGSRQAFGKKIATEEYVNTHIPETPMIYIQETTPEGATTGALWIDTSEVSMMQAEEVSF